MEHTLAAGDRISHYRIVGALGSGGMGEVYLAQDLTLERSVALKVLPSRLVRNEERLRRFVIEAKAASSLNHPSIVTIYEIGSGAIERDGEAGDPIHYIAMERIDGHTLAELIHTDREDLRRLLGYLAQAADGIAKAHGAGIVHRDLKPGNIMVSRDGFAKVLDFGLAKLMESRAADEQASAAPTRTSAHTGAGTVMGTVGYMSPEQVQGKSVDHRSDIFSFGCILYEAVTRRRAFEADSAVDTMHKILHDAPVETHELNPKAPADLRRLVRRCLAKSPDQRLQSMKDLAIELREIADNYESLSSSTSSGSGVAATLAAPRPARSRAWRIGGTIVAILGIAGLAIGLSGLFRHREASPAEAAPAAGPKITSISGRPGVSGVAISGDGRYLAYPVGSSESMSIWVRQIATGSEVQVVPPRKAGLGFLNFSPNGDYLYYLAMEADNPALTTLERVPTLGGPSRKMASDVGFGFRLTRDGKSVGFVRAKPRSAETAAIVRDLEQGQEQTLGTVAEPLAFACPPALSPDGKTFVTAIHTAEKGIHGQFVAIDAASLAQTRFGPPGWEVIDINWLPDGSGFVTSAYRYGETDEGAQLFLVSYPDGRHRRITSDSNGYFSFDLTADGGTIAAIRSVKVANVWSTPVEGKARPRQLTFNATSDNAVGQFVLLDGAVAFSAATDHYKHVFTVGADGQNPRQVTSGPSYQEVLRALPSGEILITQMGEDRTAHIAVADREGGNPRPLVRGTGEWFQGLSPDGKTMLYNRVDSLRDLWSVPVASGEPRRIATNFGYVAVVSPDNRMVAYLGVPEVEGTSPTTCFVVPIEGGAPIATFTWPQQSRLPKWTPDGKGLSFLASKDNVANLFVQPLSGGPPRPVTRLAKDGIDDYLWSPDGRRLLLQRTIDNVSNLWSAGTDGREPRPITDFPTGSIFAIDAAADGKTLYFLYGNTSNDIVLLKNFR